MNFKDIKVLYLRELRSALRDRSIVINSILLPIFLYPVMLWLVYTGFTFISGQNEELKSRVMLASLPPAHGALLKEFQADKSIVVTTLSDPATAIRSGTLDALVEFLPPKSDVPIQNNFAVKITYDESRDQSNRAKGRIDQKLSRYRDSYLAQQAMALGLSRAQFQDLWIDDE